MSQSVEQRIYEASPQAPTPAELRDGLKLLLDSYGKQTKSNNVTQQRLNAGFGQIHTDGKPTELVQFRTSFDSDKPNDQRCIGFDVYVRIDSYKEDPKNPFKRVSAIEVHDDHEGSLVAVDYEKSHNQNLSEQERREAGSLVLKVWENIVQEREPTPSTR